MVADADAEKIAEIENQIAELQKRLAELNKAPNGPGIAPSAVPDDDIQKMNWRSIGPANLAGRITAIAVVESDPTTYLSYAVDGTCREAMESVDAMRSLLDRLDDQAEQAANMDW